jgi:pimeloyl-ACP methyl ester carboxylesterase
MSTTRTHRIAAYLLGAGILLAQLGPTAAGAASAEPGPPLRLPSAELARVLKCYGPIERGGHQPVLLLPAAQRTPEANWDGGYIGALATTGRVACTVPLVANGMGDIQDSVEYVVYAVRDLARRSGRRIAIVAHSQGGFAAVWALEYWPDLAPLVDDVVTFGAAFQGVRISRTTCDARGSCEPGSWQVAQGSHFVAALNRGDPTRAETDYTTIYSDFDEFARLPRPATHLDGAREVGVQQVCPGRPVEHLQESDDAVVFALVRDALDHHGPATVSRVARTVCTAVTPPGFDVARRAAALAGQGAGEDPTTNSEPPVRCYADPACTR